MSPFSFTTHEHFFHHKHWLECIFLVRLLYLWLYFPGILHNSFFFFVKEYAQSWWVFHEFIITKMLQVLLKKVFPFLSFVKSPLLWLQEPTSRTFTQLTLGSLRRIPKIQAMRVCVSEWVSECVGRRWGREMADDINITYHQPSPPPPIINYISLCTIHFLFLKSFTS